MNSRDHINGRDAHASGLTPEDRSKTKPPFATGLLMAERRFAIDARWRAAPGVWNCFVE